MFARDVTLKLQPNQLMRFIQTCHHVLPHRGNHGDFSSYDEGVLSILKSQKGFRTS